ncbi:hypothetical protein [Faecalimonas sp.]
MNTKINYLYRDADNYKQYNEEIIAGTITEEQIQQILETLSDGEHFIPHLVGFTEVFCGPITDSDHPYFELQKTDFEETKEKPTVNLTAEQLVTEFQRNQKNWEREAFYFPYDWLELKENFDMRDLRDQCVESINDLYQWIQENS